MESSTVRLAGDLRAEQSSCADAPGDTIEIEWGPVSGRFDPAIAETDEEHISNVHVLPLLGDLAVLVRTASEWELPGGTREPGESIEDAVRRELDEEVGAAVRGFTPVGVLRCRSSAPQPFRPHIPHPEFCVLLGYAEVDYVRCPSGWGAGDGHHEISILPLVEAMRRLAGSRDHAPLARIFASDSIGGR